MKISPKANILKFQIHLKLKMTPSRLLFNGKAHHRTNGDGENNNCVKTVFCPNKIVGCSLK